MGEVEGGERVDLPLSVAFLLSAVGRRVRVHLEQELALLGLSLRHLSSLGHLSRDPGLSYSELARRADVTPQSMQATLRHLEDLAAVERRTEPGRGRSSQLHLTQHGQELLGSGAAVLRATDQLLLAGLSDEERQQLPVTLLQLFGGLNSP